ncbi:MAG TPA: sensor histidine kinase N-terminal domain-containing protein, partial [Ramlibacter sp.]
MGGKPSLRRRLSQHVLVPLVLTWALGTAVVLAVAEHFAGQAFDRALLENGYALAARVKGTGNSLSLAITPEEMNTLLFDESETLYFAVRRPDGSLVAGHPELHAMPLVGSDHEFADAVIDGRSVRTMTLQPEDRSFVIVFGQTARSRSRLLEDLLEYSALPQAALLALLAWWLRRRMERDLQPL